MGAGETADSLVHLFVNRLDTYAVQLEDGQYIREDAPLLREDPCMARGWE